MSGKTTAGAPIRVVFVGPSRDILGGQAVQLERLRARFEGDPEIAVSFIPVNPRLPGPLAALQRVKYVRTVSTGLAYVASLLAAIRRYDVVHAFSASYWSYLLAPLPAMVIGRLFGRGVVLNYRSGEAPDHLARWPLSRRTMRLAHTVAVPSGYLVEVFGAHGIAARSIFNVVDVDRFRYRERAHFAPVFLSNRNLEPLYNVACTIRAFARIQARRPEARLIVIGDGSQRQPLEQLVASLGLRQVEFRGRIPPEAMVRAYEEADIYLNSPNIDNMPGSIIEAQASGVPVVTTRSGGIPHIVTHEVTGLLVDADDDAAMADAALRILEDSALGRRLAAEGRRVCASRYVWESVRDEWVELYRDVVAAAGRRRAAVA